MWLPQQKKKQTPLQNNNVLESIRDLGTAVGKTVTQDVLGKVGSDALTALFGSVPKSGDLLPNQEISFHGTEQTPAPQVSRPAEMRPVRPMMPRMEEANLKQQIESVRSELKQLSASLKSLNQEVQKAVSDIPVEPGIYHLNFLERLRSVLKVLRQQIEDSNAWLGLWTSRKKKKGFWGQYKKHGTKFGLSSERNVSTQAG